MWGGINRKDPLLHYIGPPVIYFTSLLPPAMAFTTRSQRKKTINSPLSQGVLPLPIRIHTEDWLHEYSTNISHSFASNAFHINIKLHVLFNSCTIRQVLLYKSRPYVPFDDNVFHQLHKVT